MDTEKLKRLHEAATPGEWIAARRSSIVGRGIVASPEGRMIGNIVEHEDAPANAELIAFLRNAVPEIIAMAEERDRLREALVDHNDALRSAGMVANREGVNTNWKFLRKRITYVLADHHEVSNTAREALGIEWGDKIPLGDA